MGLEAMILGAVVVYMVFKAGEAYGRQKQSRADRLYALAQAEADPEKKRQLLLEWNELCEIGWMKRAFRDAMKRSPER